LTNRQPRVNGDDLAPNDLADWPALVLTAGLATRLRPLSDVRAKGALPVAGEAIVSRILRWLRTAGVRRVVLNLHHHPETLTGMVGDGAEWDLHVRYSWESPPLGSAGGPKRALPLLDADRFLIVNGDTLTDCSLRAVARQHLDTGARVTLAVVPRQVERAVLADATGAVTGFGPGTEHFIGVQAVDADVFDRVPAGTPQETVKGLYRDLAVRQPGAVRVYRSTAEFLDVGTVADYFRTVETIAGRERRELDRGAGVSIHPTATVQQSILWDRVAVREHAHLQECVVGDDVVIPAGARYQQCAIVNGRDGLIVAPFEMET
jgi:NDP-sugar pyrophosphorylase family protein